MQNLSIVILAAGLGTRMKSTTPKVLQTLCGEPMIVHILKQAYKLSDDVTVILYHHADEVRQEILKAYPNTKFHIQDLQNFPGTAGALFGINLNKEKVLITCGDMPLISAEHLQNLADDSAEVTMAAFYADDPSGYGRVICDSENNVKAIVEQKDATDDEKRINLVNGGCYAFKSSVLEQILPKITNQNSQKEYYLTDAIAIARGLGYGVRAVLLKERELLGVNDKYQLSIAEGLMQEQIKINLMKNGVRMRLPHTIYIDSRAKFEGECEIEENSSIIGECVIKNSVIKSSSVVESSLIDESQIGPMARIRPKSMIKSSRIGNFVETKAAVLNGVKAGHLSYLGDCEIDSGTNVGCGSITCNYDGKSKHKTKIGKNVFIGSNTNLIAPVTVGDDVLVAAGSTISSDVKSGELAIARAKERRIEGGFYKFFKSDNDAKR
ncbi:bifunctional UDP-N-acetylglucosamine diphosphorylase/glucosamine-1-phosphate N-acetyltransferase GlmU [Campylobacter sp. 19-13652]|uniref:bifunctional UDP-N-acetylglucosamine diphosphorylase/glucosamine-1-phosphate N-acetyltransferase GlmU n=1 Tax=Campylobacter sp. 19-13652 TaxID=2840180 RepID=UPI001C7888BA|nr:bifunctional UDP-N-acetylglucosamine diphosphorylase/glucosamine-1-phosphate N-acetyltransferase GlmU [Campylobacter sp. 19-13652]BCX79444.1 bifunctional protein GlmU [Campylobacter sp. 19-13652]